MRFRLAEDQPSGARLDIQGLRALAVLAVIADHFFHWPSGGFVGVDVFFVVSGFLITGLLLREQQRDGRISLADFYRRRARRILPVAVLVIALTVAAGYYVYNAARGKAIAEDGFWALVFASNWHFGIQGTDYFQLDTVSPLQHYWSLAVEEQFYLVWPWLIMAVVGTSGRRKRWLGPAMLFVVLVSFGYSMWHTDTTPTWAYFSTFDRAWELGVGALLAVVAPQLSRIPGLWRHSIGWMGLIGIGVSLFVIDAQSAFPAPWVALPVLSTGLVIAAGVGGSQPFLLPLVNPVAGYVGDISYSLYLWHFPIIILAAAYFPRGGLEYYVWAVGLTVALSVSSFHFLEDPIRASSWLDPRSKKLARQRQPGRGNNRRATKRASGAAALGMLTVVTLMLAFAAMLHDQEDPRSTATGRLSQPLSTSEVPKLSPHQQAIEKALNATSFPKLKPGLDQLGGENWRDDVSEEVGCFDVDASDRAECVNGDPSAEKSVVVLGDSVAIAYMPTVVAALEPKGYRIQQLTLEQCPVWDVPVKLGDGRLYTECDDHRKWVQSVVAEQKPDLAILSTSYDTLTRLGSGADTETAAEEAQAGLTRAIRSLRKHVKTVVVLEPPPVGAPLQECVTNVGVPEDCSRTIKKTFYLGEEAERSVAKAEGAQFVNTRLWYCDAYDNCPGFVGNTPIRADGVHLTVQYAQQMASMLRRAIKAE